jgi:hypothetical protein
MKSDALTQRLVRLAPGHVELLSDEAFRATFGDVTEGAKQAAVSLGEAAGFSVMFSGSETAFAVFRKRQDRGKIYSGWDVRRTVA